MIVNLGKIATLCLVWAFLLLLGLSLGLNLPFILAVVGTVIYLLQ